MKSGLGYTLIELLVVMAIISMIAVIGFVSLKAFEDDQDLKNALQDIQSNLRFAQSSASSRSSCVVGANQYDSTSWSGNFSKDSSTPPNNKMFVNCFWKDGNVLRNSISFKNNLQITNLCIVKFTLLSGAATFEESPSACIQNGKLIIELTNTNNGKKGTVEITKQGVVNAQLL